MPREVSQAHLLIRAQVCRTQGRETGAWERRVGKGKEEAHPRLMGGERRDAGVLSHGHKAPAAFRMCRAPVALGPHLLRAEAPNLRQSGVRSNDLTKAPDVPSASCAQLLQSKGASPSPATLPPPDFPMSAKGTNLITRALKCQTPTNQVSVPQDDSYFCNLSRISLFFSISAAKFQLSLRLTWTLST